ncbi:ATP-binding protein [Lysinibacillus pakistanensis]|uniref:histidine kinase n=1 Tax=Lysinibacillus pakistanensis TaxID=759811 RepID=A0AAX3WQ20_9BACI|nr:ATP-binding protein [Lysinibacillus pakistanensis]MDM5234340.1 histidine kinase [Lysinibacillus pakistanensis]WHY44929.1 histidine kinase [Lysinibacillus pakistanensis]WHY49936.1 histidine kinase [Lysinibacillus pakistanensis]
MELRSTKFRWFWLTIGIYVIIGIYLLFTSYSKPFINIEIEEKGENWIVTNPYYKDWANKYEIVPGDIILKVDGKDIKNISNVKYEFVIRTANKLTLEKPNGEIVHVKIKPFDIPQQFYYVFVVPTIYYFLSLILSLYLYLKQKNTPLLNLLILFILTVSLAYVSIGASGILNNVGIIVNRSSMLLCPVLLIHFLRLYFDFLNIKWLFINNIKILYVLPLSVVFLSIFGITNSSTHVALSNIILGIFFLLLIIILGIMISGNFKYKIPQLKILLSSIIIPFMPFLFLYALPEVIFHKQILSADICSLFLVLIPYSFICTQLTERLFDMEYFITRLRHYFNFSFAFTIWLMIGLYWITDLSISRMTEIFFFTFLSLIGLFYIKEKIDYRKRKILFSTKGDYIHRLYTTVDSIGRVVKIEDLLERFVQEVSLHLEIHHVYVLTYDFHTHAVTSTSKLKEYTQNQVDEVFIEQLRLGDIKKTAHFYVAFIHQDTNYKRILVVDHNQSIYLKEEELLWLELVLLYLNNFIENTKMVEGLLEQLKHMKAADKSQLPWLNKLLWLRFEEEKYQLAQELHDTNLQEQLHIAREMDVLVRTKNTDDLQTKLSKIHEHMLASLNDLRGYCENLKPPLLDTLGLNAALEKLIQKIHKRAEFVLVYTIDRLYLEDERLNLMIYRLFQELLNNALKHSYADTVEINLFETEDGFEINYSDNGVGCKMDDIILADSMGIRGMQERVQAFNGQFSINTNLGEGMSIRIIVNEGNTSTTYDYDICNKRHVHSTIG